MFEKSFNQALGRSFEKKRFFFLASVLVLAGLLNIFCRSFVFYTGKWGDLSLFFLPLIFSLGLLLAAGVFLIRLYQYEQKGEIFSFRKVLFDSLESMLFASYLTLPLLLIFLILWVVLGIFLVLMQVPLFGMFFSVVFAFLPMLLFFGFLLLLISIVFMAFFLTPSIALGSSLKMREVISHLCHKIGSNFSLHLLGLTIGILPTAVVFALLLPAALWTKKLTLVDPSSVENMVLEIVIMVPFVAILTPAVNFFFNFAAQLYDAPHGE